MSIKGNFMMKVRIKNVKNEQINIQDMEQIGTN